MPWNAAGRAAEGRGDGDSVVRDTGWVFNNATGSELTLAEFVNSGEHEVGAYLEYFGFDRDVLANQSLVEIGSGIGRMTAGFTRRFATVTAADLDAAFLERCRETVTRFGNPAVLRTVHIPDGNSLAVPDSSVDPVFSYIVMQHCKSSDALRLTRESLRVLRPGGWLALNFRPVNGYGRLQPLDCLRLLELDHYCGASGRVCYGSVLWG